MSLSLSEIVETGPILVYNSEVGVVISVNSVYLRLWMRDYTKRSDSFFEEIDVRSFSSVNGSLLNLPLRELMEKAQQFFKDYMEN